jgi:hypothetical protein
VIATGLVVAMAPVSAAQPAMDAQPVTEPSSGQMAVAFAPIPGVFSWDGTFVSRLRSRTYSAGAGTHKIVTKSNAVCRGGTHYKIRVVREVGGPPPDVPGVWQTYSCASDGTRQWSSLQAGNYHFDIEKHNVDNDATWAVQGTTYYPG